MTIKQKLAFYFLFYCIIFTSCSNDIIFYEYHNVDLWNWTDNDTVKYELPKITKNGEINADIGIRSTNSYAYNDLFLLGILECDGEIMKVDTLTINLYNAKGNSNGEGFPYITTTKDLSTIHVDSGHTYTYKVIHIMKTGKVKGIKSIGLKLTSK